LDEAEEGLGGGAVGEALPTVLSGHRQAVTICNGLTPLFIQPVLQYTPVGAGSLRIRLLAEDFDDVDDGEPPGFGGLVVDAADGLDQA
jgi:hypothetical protein